MDFLKDEDIEMLKELGVFDMFMERLSVIKKIGKINQETIDELLVLFEIIGENKEDYLF